jgi:hypothetical protein
LKPSGIWGLSASNIRCRFSSTRAFSYWVPTWICSAS